MVYIIGTLLRKAQEKYEQVKEAKDVDDMWKTLMLTPLDYGRNALLNDSTKSIMEKIEFEHGGLEYDSKYPEGIPTSVEIKTKSGKTFDSGLVMFPGGHARNETVSLNEILKHKFKVLGKLALEKNEMIRMKIQLDNIGDLNNEELLDIYDCNIKFADESIDDLSSSSKK